MQTISRRLTLALLSLSLCGLTAARADDLPALRIIVPTPPGGTNDGVARALQMPLQKLLNRNVIIEYKAGAASAMGSALVARSKPDGNTLLLNNNAVLINPLISRVGYEMSELTPLVVAAVSPMVLIVNSDVPATDVKTLIEYARKQSQPLPYASSGGVGSLGHLAMEGFARATGIKLLHVPYQCGGPAQLAVSSGEVKLVMTSLNAALKGQVDAGRIRLLGVASEKPTPLVPGVPPIGDTVPDFVLAAWFGLLAPAQTPPAALETLNQALMQALAMPETRERLLAIGSQPTAIGPVPFAAMIDRETRRWTAVIREQKISKD
ncbi:MAG: tripartite tricarboxylate transporter substrate binding protein [Ramlibacter sp.]